MFLLPFVAVAWQPTDRARVFADDVRAAILSAGMNYSEAADAMGMSLCDLSEALACRKPLNVFRLSDMPDTFWEAFDSRRAKRRGGMYLSADMVLLLRGATLLKRRMLKVESVSLKRKVG